MSDAVNCGWKAMAVPGVNSNAAWRIRARYFCCIALTIPVGHTFAETIGYPAALLAGSHSVACDAFAGVSNVSLFASSRLERPFSTWAAAPGWTHSLPILNCDDPSRCLPQAQLRCLSTSQFRRWVATAVFTVLNGSFSHKIMNSSFSADLAARPRRKMLY